MSFNLSALQVLLRLQCIMLNIFLMLQAHPSYSFSYGVKDTHSGGKIAKKLI